MTSTGLSNLMVKLANWLEFSRHEFVGSVARVFREETHAFTKNKRRMNIPSLKKT